MALVPIVLFFTVLLARAGAQAARGRHVRGRGGRAVTAPEFQHAHHGHDAEGGLPR